MGITNPVDVSPAWRSLADHYKSQIDSLRASRDDKQAQKDTLQDKLDGMDWAKATDESQKQFYDKLHDVLESDGDAGKTYFKGFGSRDSVIDAGTTILTKTLPDLKEALDAQWAPLDMLDQQNQLQENINHFDNDMADLDKQIDTAERNMDLSNQAADAYSQNIVVASAEHQQIVFKLVEKSKQANQTAATAVQQYLDTVPAGWIRCTCPAAHQSLGRYINGALYHPNGYSCPK